MSIDTVKRTFSKLEKMVYLLVGNFNKDPRDKIKWYTLKDEKLKELYFEMRDKETGVHSVFFQAKDTKVMDKAFKNVLSSIDVKEKNKESTHKEIDKFKEIAKNSISKDKVKNKQKEQSLGWIK